MSSGSPATTSGANVPPGLLVWLGANAFGLIAGWTAGVLVLDLLMRPLDLFFGPFGLLVRIGGALLGQRLIAAPMLRPGGASDVLPLLVGVQAAVFLAVVFLPFGFDHPSKLGLDFGHLLLLGALDASALFLGLTLAFATRRWMTCAFQLGLPALFFLLVASGLTER